MRISWIIETSVNESISILCKGIHHKMAYIVHGLNGLTDVLMLKCLIGSIVKISLSHTIVWQVFVVLSYPKSTNNDENPFSYISNKNLI